MNSSLSTSNDMPRPGKTLKPLSVPLSYQRASFSRWEVSSLATFEWRPKFCRTSSYDYNQRRYSRTHCWIGSYMHVLIHTCVYPVCSPRLNYTASQPLQFLRKSRTFQCCFERRSQSVGAYYSKRRIKGEFGWAILAQQMTQNSPGWWWSISHNRRLMYQVHCVGGSHNTRGLFRNNRRWRFGRGCIIIIRKIWSIAIGTDTGTINDISLREYGE